MALPEGTREALFIAEILADTAANSWNAGGTELPSTDDDAELLELLGSLDADVAEFTDCLHRESALASAKKSTVTVLKKRLADAANKDSLDVYGEHNTETIRSLFEEKVTVAKDKSTEKPAVKALLRGVDCSVTNIATCLAQVKARVEGAESEEDVRLDGATGVLESDFRCKYTGDDMKDPKVAPCGHVFSKNAFTQLFAGAASGAKSCPATGCSAKYTEAELEDDPRTAALMKHSQGLRIKQASNADDDIEDSSDDEFQPAGGGAAAAPAPAAGERPIKAEPKRR